MESDVVKIIKHATSMREYDVLFVDLMLPKISSINEGLLNVLNTKNLILISRVYIQEETQKRIFKLTHVKCPHCSYTCHRKWKKCPICHSSLKK